MTLKTVTVIDYGVGNLLSVRRGLEYNDALVKVTGDPEEIFQSDRVVLPGVGAFADGMAELDKRDFISLIHDLTSKGTPLLGICLGMQFLLDESEEFGLTDGLGLISGKVTAVPSNAKDGSKLKIPHIGWNNLVKPKEGGVSWKGTLLEDTKEDSALYFVHSYMAQPEDSKHLIAGCLYGDNFIPAVIQSENVIGCQFHPEKSGKIGLQMLKNFLNI